MKVAWIIGGVIIAMMGVVWTLQGLGATYVPTSFMTKAPEWILIGLVTIAAGVILVVRTIRKP